MKDFELRRLQPRDEASFLTALGQWDTHPSFGFGRGYKAGMPFSEYLHFISQQEKGVGLPANFVAETFLFGFEGEVLVGQASIRHSLTEHLHRLGGHIGYGVLPPFRRKGFATEMLKMALPEAKALGITKVLVTCNDDNVGSIKTIESNGGLLENKVFVAEGKPLKRRYWIDLS